MYAFDGGVLAAALKRLTTDNAKNEEYLTEALTILSGDGRDVGTAENDIQVVLCEPSVEAQRGADVVAARGEKRIDAL